MKIGDRVSIFIDRDHTCPRGLAVPFIGRTIFIGNGIACQNRNEWFGSKAENRYTTIVTLLQYC